MKKLLQFSAFLTILYFRIGDSSGCTIKLCLSVVLSFAVFRIDRLWRLYSCCPCLSFRPSSILLSCLSFTSSSRVSIRKRYEPLFFEFHIYTQLLHTFGCCLFIASKARKHYFVDGKENCTSTM